MNKKKGVSRRELSKGLAIVAGLGIVHSARALGMEATPAQVEGPFHPLQTDAESDMDLTLLEGHSKPALGEIILVQGRVLDVNGEPVENALVDVWQANHHGRYSHAGDPNTAPLDPDFQGWGLMTTRADGAYAMKTIQPGAYPLSFLGEEGWRCRHIHFKVSCPGYESLTTQMYFEGDPLIEQDQEIAKAPAELRHLLIAAPQVDGQTGLPLYGFDVVLATAEA